MSNGTLSWSKLMKVLSEAGVIIKDDDCAVSVEGQRGSNAVFLVPFDGDTKTKLRECDNTTVTTAGSSAWVTDEEGSETQLSFYKTWVIAGDLDI